MKVDLTNYATAYYTGLMPARRILQKFKLDTGRGQQEHQRSSLLRRGQRRWPRRLPCLPGLAAKQEAIDKVEVDDLDNLATTEMIMLSAVSGEGAQDRSDRTVFMPLVKFLWESY